MKNYIESEACLVKRCRATRGSPSALPSSRAGPTVLTAARASPFRGFSNSTYTKSSKSCTNRDTASNEILISAEQQLLTTPFFLATANTCRRATSKAN